MLRFDGCPHRIYIKQRHADSVYSRDTEIGVEFAAMFRGDTYIAADRFDNSPKLVCIISGEPAGVYMLTHKYILK